MSVTLESPVVGHEQVEDLILNARRKLFPISVANSLVLPSPTTVLAAAGEQGDAHLGSSVSHVMSLTSVGDADFSTASSTTENSTRKRMVSFAQIPAVADLGTAITSHAKHTQLPSLGAAQPSNQDRPNNPLIRARLVTKTGSKTYTLVLSFPRLICDFWSSCLFMQQLADLYRKLEKSANYRPSVAAMKLENKRQSVVEAYEREKKKSGAGRKVDAATRLLMKRAQQPSRVAVMEEYIPMVLAKLKFPQVAQREKQLLMMLSRDHLLAFWEGVVTATIRRERGMNRTKVVPPVRIPSGLGEMPPLSNYRRPQTSRLRPLTASRAHPVTARRQGGGAFGEAFPREALLGPKTKFQFIKVNLFVHMETTLVLFITVLAWLL